MSESRERRRRRWRSTVKCWRPAPAGGIRNAAWRGVALSDNEHRTELVLSALTGSDKQLRLMAIKVVREMKDDQTLKACLGQWKVAERGRTGASDQCPGGSRRSVFPGGYSGGVPIIGEGGSCSRHRRRRRPGRRDQRGVVGGAGGADLGRGAGGGPRGSASAAGQGCPRRDDRGRERRAMRPLRPS